MANQILTNNIVAKAALPILRNKLPLVGLVNRQYEEDITDANARLGGVINYKRPPRYIGRDGELMQIESTIETSRQLTLGISGVDVSFSMKDLMLSMDDVKRGGLNTVLDPAMTTIASKIEVAGMQLYKGIANTVGTPGTPPTSSTVIARANAQITSAGGAISGKRGAVVDPYTDASLADQLSLRFNPQNEQSKTYRAGMMGEALGFEFYDSPAVQSHTAGIYGGTPMVNGAGQTGSTLVTDGWTVTTTSLNVGDAFTIAGVNAINPQTRADTGALMNFVVTAKTVTDGSGNSTISISPAITPGGQFQNVANAPADNAVITITTGASGVVSRQSLLFDPAAFTFACAPMALVPGEFGAKSARASDKMSGLSISMTTQFDIKNYQVLTRFDVLYAWDLAYPELAVRLEG